MDEKLDALTERLIEKLERAIDELDSYTVSVKTKEKVVEYEDDGKKPSVEKTVETEEIRIEKGLIDRAALKQLVSTLNELKGKDEDTAGSISVFLSEEARELAQ